VVIDVEINRIQVQAENRLVGDVDFASALSQVAAITPDPVVSGQ
jgi:methylenetetrahydrofolate dehydrogenase (NADP+)/methenyltetrahydrofolate cyclohydrolase